MRPSAFLLRHVITLGLVLVIVLAYRVAGAAGSALAGQSAFALAALIPVATMHRLSVLAPAPAPTPESYPSVMATEMSAS